MAGLAQEGLACDLGRKRARFAFDAELALETTVAGNQAGNASYSAASQATQSFTVGSTLVTVPDVLGYPQAAASSALATSGLSLGTVSTASSDTVAAGSIASESPAAGTQVGYGSAVNLLMSTGPNTSTALILVNPSQALQGGGGCSSYTLNAGPGTVFDDDGAIFLNGTPIFLDSVHTAHTVAPVTFDACAGDLLEVVGYNWATPCEEVGPLSLTDNTSGLAHVLDAAGYGSAGTASLCNNLPGGGYPFYDRTFAIPGASVSVAITGQLTHFVQGTSSASFGAGITVQSLTVTSSTSAVASLIVDPAAAIGGRDVSVTTGSESASLPSALAVTAAPAALSAVFPSNASVGATGVVVTLAGRYTHFAQGTTSVDFGPGVTLESLTVTSPTSASAIVTVDPAASASTNRVSVTTGTEVVSLFAAFSIYAESPPSCATGLSAVNYSQSGIDLGQGAQTAFNGGIWNAGASGAQWVQVDLAIDQSISEVQFYTAQSPDGATSYSVYVAPSPIGSAYGVLTPVASTSGNTVNLQQITLPFTPVTGRFVEIVANGGPSLTGLQNATLACSQGGGAELRVKALPHLLAGFVDGCGTVTCVLV